MIPAPPNWHAVYQIDGKLPHKTYEPVVGWDDDGYPLVPDDSERLRRADPHRVAV